MGKKVILSKNAEEVAKSRYFNEGEDWETCTRRVADAIAHVEKDKEIYAQKFQEMIYNMDFIPAGRILRNASRAKGSLMNCYVIPIGDSIEEIGKFIADSLTLWSEGGGVGCLFSPLRPKNEKILGKGGKSSGMVSFIKAADAVSKTIESGGQRRAAALACCDVSHPEVLDFINAKLVDGDISHFNISVLVDEEFIKAVESDNDWTFKFKQKEYGKVKAREIWNLIVDNMIKKAEPGFLNKTNLYKNNSYYYDPVVSTNPCITGDTLVYVADGRGHVSIKTLSEEDKDIPVFSYNESKKQVEVKIMRRPRITGYNQKILKITLDDGSVFRCTENHKIFMKDGSLKRADGILPGDRLTHLISYNAPLEEIFPDSNSKSQDYRWILNKGYSISEHRLIASYKIGRNLKTGEIVHHCDRNGLNNSFENLEVMIKKDHDKLHGDLIRGDNNPMRRFPEKNYFKYHKFLGIENGNSMGFTKEEIMDKAIEFCKSLTRKSHVGEWKEYCRKNNFPYDSFYIFGDYGHIGGFLEEAARRANVVNFDSYHHGEYNKYLKLKEETDLNIFFDNGIFVKKICEGCKEEFIVPWSYREASYHTRTCFNISEHKKQKTREDRKTKYNENKENIFRVFKELETKFGRKPLLYELTEECRKQKVSLVLHGYKKPSEDYFGYYNDVVNWVENRQINYQVVSIEEDGFEDVYNGTVDDNHNFYSMVNNNQTESGKSKYNYILSKQCGEAILSNYESCDLGSLVLPNFITGNVNTNWKKLGETIKLAVRFLDNVIDVNKYSLKEIDIKTHNSRRIGLGIMGLAEYLFSKELRYGSKEAINEIEKLMRFIRDNIYQTLVELSVEKGSFPKFDSVQYGNASFVRKLPAQLRMDIKKYGVRCVSGMAMAPNGTISLLPEVTSGIEPLMFKAYKRKDRVGERIYIHPKYKEILLRGDSVPDWYVDMSDLTPKDHFETQAIIQRYTDGAVSKTINLPEGTTSEQLNHYLLEYIRDLKGVTVYVDKSRDGQVYNKLSEDEVFDIISQQTIGISNSMDGDDIECKCQKKDDDAEADQPVICEIPTKSVKEEKKNVVPKRKSKVSSRK